MLGFGIPVQCASCAHTRVGFKLRGMRTTLIATGGTIARNGDLARSRLTEFGTNLATIWATWLQERLCYNTFGNEVAEVPPDPGEYRRLRLQ